MHPLPPKHARNPFTSAHTLPIRLSAYAPITSTHTHPSPEREHPSPRNACTPIRLSMHAPQPPHARAPFVSACTYPTRISMHAPHSPRRACSPFPSARMHLFASACTGPIHFRRMHAPHSPQPAGTPRLSRHTPHSPQLTRSPFASACTRPSHQQARTTHLGMLAHPASACAHPDSPQHARTPFA